MHSSQEDDEQRTTETTDSSALAAEDTESSNIQVTPHREAENTHSIKEDTEKKVIIQKNSFHTLSRFTGNHENLNPQNILKLTAVCGLYQDNSHSTLTYFLSFFIKNHFSYSGLQCLSSVPSQQHCETIVQTIL